MSKKDELEMFVVDDIYEIIEIGFLDHKIKTVIDEYQNIWISVESICDHLKIDSEEQIESLIDSDLDVWILKVFDSNLGKYDLFMINIGSVKLWLNTIRFNYVRFESRGILIRYRYQIVNTIKTAVSSSISMCNVEKDTDVVDELIFDKSSAIEKDRKQKETKKFKIEEKKEVKIDEIIEVEKIDFCDGRIELLKYGSDIWINVKSVCDLFGISYSEQHVKLESRDWKDWVIWKILNKKFVIHLYCFRDWLFKLDPSKLQEDKRYILIRYRKEVTIDAIEKAFSEEIKRDKSIDEVEDEIEDKVKSTKKVDDSVFEYDAHRRCECDVIEIDFGDGKIEVVKDVNGVIWVNVKQVCKRLKIDERFHIEVLKKKDWANWSIVLSLGADGKRHKRFMLHLDSFKEWLRYINKGSVKPRFDISRKYRNKLIEDIKRAFIKKADNCDYFMDKDEVNEIKVEVNKKTKDAVDRVYDSKLNELLPDFRAIEDNKTSIIEDHYVGEEVVGRAVYDTDGEEGFGEVEIVDDIDLLWEEAVKEIEENDDEEVKGEGKEDFKEDIEGDKVEEVEEDEKSREECPSVEENKVEEVENGGAKRPVIEVEEGTVKCDILEEEKDEEMKEEKMQEIMSYPFYFEDEIVITFVYEGKPCWIAKDIGDILGYARDGKRLIALINDWSEEFIHKGVDYIILTGKELKQFKDTTRAVSSYSSRLMLIFKGGLEFVCDRTNNSIGVKLKKFLMEEVVPKIDKPEEKKIEKDIEEEKTEVITTSFKEEGTNIVPVKEKTYQVVEVDFYDGTIHAIMDEDGNIWMSVRRACEHIGVDYSGQHQRLKDLERSPWSNVGVIPTLDVRGRNFKHFMLHIDSVPMWLATINLKRVNPKSKEVLTKYQLEAANVLRNYFLGNRMQQFGRYEIPSYPDTLRAYADLLEKNNLLVIERDGAISEAKHQSYLANNMAMRLESKKDAISVGEKLASSKGGLTIADFGNAVKINGKVYGSGKMRELLKRWGVFTKDDKKPRNYHLRERQWFEVNVDFYIDEDGIQNQLSCIVITTKGQMNVLLKMSNDVEFEGKSIVFDGEEYNGQGYFPFKNKKKNEKF